ncbi:LptF/LptG family permease [Candidatus Kinetoplastidibacterium crithidiae]|uniref:Lipopolysaccharide export system permease protein n=1 Tax=Candidatus Kinetoplastidibacterium crithidiae TCC036E TaxID=1208918 RepID=M1L509_9PROT|nr:LptF/LptG family permease [Candidatus Kinetoplastibacterium crithidii]AFZ82605.1 hypothetical protein CKCE_0166 [Candidatus Kinetoplastibacterium crithidii (ex Angomonas deanei ATCC 30255)]AGF47733.1 lipopolysaccharide export system permease protein [Candidatus Kinetoplastibacterium crithidii TCC036E]
MSIFKKSFFYEINKNFAFVLSILIFIWFSIIIIRIFKENFLIDLSINNMFKMVFLHIITALPIIMTVSLFIAVIRTIMRSYRDSEMIVWMISGLSLKDVYNLVLTFSIPISLIIMIFSLFLSPIAYRKIEQIHRSSLEDSNLYKVSPGNFMEFNSGNIVFFAENINKNNEFSNVFVRLINHNEFILVTAKSLKIDKLLDCNNFFVMKGVSISNIGSNSSEITFTHFDEYEVCLDDFYNTNFNSSCFMSNKRFMKGLSTKRLFFENSNLSWSYIVGRISIPIVALNLSFLAIPLGKTNARNRSINFFIAVLLALVYFSIVGLFQLLVLRNSIGIIFGLISPHIIIYFLYLALVKSRIFM